ncbi:hypothetical protein [Enterocloster sp.]|uniref:hypothetical protein n=1 Tax=Enterocloster sp. TaxID=2719315 RepID=UPI0039A24437
MGGRYTYRFSYRGELVPAAVVVHGWWKTKESQSSTAMELARRGIVALAIDMYGHDSSNVKFNFVDSYNGLNYWLHCLTLMLTVWALQVIPWRQMLYRSDGMGGPGGSVDAAMVIAGTDPTYQDKDGAWISAYGSRCVHDCGQI